MQAQVEAASAQGYASDEARQTLAEAQQVLGEGSYDNKAAEQLLSRMAQVLHDMEYA